MIERAESTLSNTRVAVRSALSGSPADRPNDVILVVSELVANALRHGRDPVRLLVREEPFGVLVAVFDSAPGRPFHVQPGGGLHVVSYLAGGEWGVHEGDLGKWVWARVRERELPGTAAHRPRPRRVPRGC